MSNHASQEQTPCISISGLTKAFGSLVAVDHLHLEVMRGDIFGFLGTNGSGKTTTIRMLLGLIKPDAGHIRLFGLDATRHRDAIVPRLGAMIEMPVFYPYLSGMDNLRTVAAASGMQLGRSNEKRIGEVLDLIDLSSRAKDIYRTYSLGMKQRLGIGAALLTDPELILLDEPTNGLDPAGVHEIRQFILRLAQLGKTVFISSHLLYEVQHVCNRVAILQKGTLIAQGNVRELLRLGERVVVRLGAQEEVKRAYEILQKASTEGSSWIEHISRGNDEQNLPVLYVNAPEQHYGEITALLAQQHLYITGMHPEKINLEKYFLELTAARGATQDRPETTASIGEPRQG